MARTNYSFAKRQRDLAKKKKKEEKLRKKMDAREQAKKSDEEGSPSSTQDPVEPTDGTSDEPEHPTNE